jgi:hypothetical protein
VFLLPEQLAMKERRVYARKISSEEAREGYVMILKNKLAFFPPVGEAFDLIHNNVRSRVRVESYRCTCRGPDLPHEHYFIRWKGLKTSDRIKIREDPSKQGSYLINVHH